MARDAAQSGKPSGSDKLKIFISYSRRDAAAADAIVAALGERGFEVKIDTRDLPFGEEWQKELAEFIRVSDTVIWLVSEASIRSEWVNWELDEVKARNKRLVPVMVGLVNPAELPRQLGAIHILPPERVFDFSRDLDLLVKVLDTDHAWLKQATRWQDRAAEWLAKGRTSALLLSRGALAEAERWKDTRPAKAPPPAQEVLDLLLASRQAATRRQRWVVGGSIAATTVAVALAGFAWWQREQAVEQEKIALAERDRAARNESIAIEQRDRAYVTESRFLADLADKQLTEGDTVTAALLAIEGLADAKSSIERPNPPEARYQLDRAWRELKAQRKPQEKIVLPHNLSGGINQCLFSPDGLSITTLADGVEIRSAQTGMKLATLPEAKEANGIRYAGGGTNLLIRLPQALQLWAADGKQKIGEVTTEGKPGYLSINDSGTSIFYETADRTIWHWDLGANTAKKIFSTQDKIIGLPLISGRPFALLIGKSNELYVVSLNDNLDRAHLGKHTKDIAGAAWASDGSRLVTWEDNGEIKVWRTRDNSLILTRNIEGIQFEARAALSKSGRLLVYTNGKSYTLLDIDDQREIATLDIGQSIEGNILFSADEKFVVAAMAAGEHGAGQTTARVWDTATGKLIGLLRHNGSVDCLSISPDSQKIATGSYDDTLRLWLLDLTAPASQNGGEEPTGEFVATLQTGDEPIEFFEFDIRGSRLVTLAKNSGRAALFDGQTGEHIAFLVGHKAGVTRVQFSIDGARLYSRSTDGAIKVWNSANGDLIASFDGHGEKVWGIGEQDKARLIATVDDKQVIRLWDIDAKKRISEIPFAPKDVRWIKGLADDILVGVLNNDKFELWSIVERNLRAELAGHVGPDETVTIMKTTVAIEDEGGVIRVFDRGDGSQLATIDSHREDRLRHVVAREADIIVTENGDSQHSQRKTYRVWDARTGLQRSEFEGRTRPAGIWLSPDGSRFFRSDLDEQAMVDTSTGRIIFESFVEHVQAVSFSTDGKMVAINPRPGVVILDTATGKKLVSLRPREEGVELIGFSPDMSRLLSTSHGGGATLWRVAPASQQLVDSVKSVMPRCLHYSQRTKFFLNPEPPRWCITGPGLERLQDPAKWLPKWPYHTADWRDWLIARDRGEKPPLPQSK